MRREVTSSLHSAEPKVSTRAGGGKAASAGAPLRGVQCISLEQARDYLFGTWPALFVASDGTVLASNRIAEWLYNRSSQQNLLGVDVCELFAGLFMDGAAPLSCNIPLARRKLAFWRKTDPDRASPLHKPLADALPAAVKTQRSHPCPVVVPDDPGKLGNPGSQTYPLSILPPQASHYEEMLHFYATDFVIAVGEADGQRAQERERFLVLFAPSDAETALAVRRALGALSGTIAEGTYVVPHDIFTLLYNDIKYGDDSAIENKELGSLIRTIRERDNLTADELARRVGVSRPTITHWESGRRALGKSHHAQVLFNVLASSPEEYEQLATLAGFESKPVEQFAAEGEFAAWSMQKLERLTFLQSRIASLQTQIADYQAEFDRDLEEFRAAAEWRALRFPALEGARPASAPKVDGTVFDRDQHRS